jgi:hypothetical protein
MKNSKNRLGLSKQEVIEPSPFHYQENHVSLYQPNLDFFLSMNQF